MGLLIIIVGDDAHRVSLYFLSRESKFMSSNVSSSISILTSG